MVRYLIRSLCIFKIKLLYNEEKLVYTKTELLSFKVTLPLAKLDIVGSSPVSNCLIFSDNILVDIQLVAFFYYLMLGS